MFASRYLRQNRSTLDLIRCSKSADRGMSNNLNDQSYSLIEVKKEGNKCFYSFTFDKLLRTLQPTLTEEDIQNWMTILFNEIESDKAKPN